MKVACGMERRGVVGAGDGFSMLFDPRRGCVPECLFTGGDATGRGGWFGECHGEGDGWCGGRRCESDGARWQACATTTASSTASARVSAAPAGILLSAAVSSAGRVSATGLCAALSAAAAVSISGATAATAGAMVSGALVSVCAAEVRGDKKDRIDGGQL